GTRRVTDGQPCERKEARTLLRKIAEGTHICGDPGMQFDTTIHKWHTCKGTGRQNSTNPCSEYLFLDNTACNLASLNLLKFKTVDGEFDVERFKAAVRIFITAQEIRSEGTHICGDPGMQFDTTIHKWHTCKGTGRQNSTNPCSEYLFLDNTACNLASLNLLKFKTVDGEFDVERFKAAVRIFITAQEI